MRFDLVSFILNKVGELVVRWPLYSNANQITHQSFVWNFRKFQIVLIELIFTSTNVFYASYFADEIENDTELNFTQFHEIFEFDSNETESYVKQKCVMHLNCNRRSVFFK